MGIDRAESRRGASATVAVLLLATLGGCVTSQGGGEVTARDDWLTAARANQVANAMGAKGMMAATVDCRFDNNTPGNLAYSTRFTWKKAPKNARWHWEVGDPAYLASKEVRANRAGLHRTFARTVQDKATGQKVGCAIWAS